MNLNSVITTLKLNKQRITPIRKDVLLNIISAKAPVSAQEILKTIKSKHDSVNKTTIYRELDFLRAQNIIKEIEFGDGKKRYEIIGEKHHHHIVCVSCKRVEDVIIDANLSKTEQKITEENKFVILDHSLEYFGICQNCARDIKN